MPPNSDFWDYKHIMCAPRLSALLIALLWSGISFGQSTFDLIVKGKSCVEQKNQQLDCDYKIGTHFWLSIAGVGNRDAGITFMKSDFNGRYYGTFGVMHGCVIVKAGIENASSALLDLAFVSPKNGKVYQDWQSCQA